MQFIITGRKGITNILFCIVSRLSTWVKYYYQHHKIYYFYYFFIDYILLLFNLDSLKFYFWFCHCLFPELGGVQHYQSILPPYSSSLKERLRDVYCNKSSVLQFAHIMQTSSFISNPIVCSSLRLTSYCWTK